MGKLIPDLSSVTAVGLDLAKHVFQVHCVDASGRVVAAKAIRRKHLLEFFASLPRCLVGLEASGSAHHWARELITLGHEVRMMPPAYVKPYIRRQKNDASDAAAICEAVTRPMMRFVGVRSLENQAALMRHKTREMLVSQRTQLVNGPRGHLTEVGVIAASATPAGLSTITIRQQIGHTSDTLSHATSETGTFPRERLRHSPLTARMTCWRTASWAATCAAQRTSQLRKQRSFAGRVKKWVRSTGAVIHAALRASLAVTIRGARRT